jgi:Cu-Zn family superoxide dismutase
MHTSTDSWSPLSLQVLISALGLLLSLSTRPCANESDWSLPITTELKNADGQIVGHATVTPQEAGVRVAVWVKGLLPGTYPIHFHTVGKCDPPNFTSSGGVFGSPLGHMVDESGQPHPPEGNLPNLTVGPDGSANSEVINPHVTFWTTRFDSLLHPGGTSLIIHAAHSKKIIACGVIAREQTQQLHHR